MKITIRHLPTGNMWSIDDATAGQHDQALESVKKNKHLWLQTSNVEFVCIPSKVISKSVIKINYE
jgi:hypothetical protein